MGCNTIYIYKIGYRIRRYRQGLLEILDGIMPIYNIHNKNEWNEIWTKEYV
jgi:hypothetical protein